MDETPSGTGITKGTILKTVEIDDLSEDLISKEEGLNILILGSYRGSGSIDDLARFRDLLIKKGMKKAHLALDIEHDISPAITKAENNYVNSFDQIKDCDFEIFVLYGNRDNSGPAMELQHSLESNFEEKVYVGMRSKGANELSSMIRGAIDHHKIVKYDFESLEDLADAFEGYLIDKELT